MSSSTQVDAHCCDSDHYRIVLQLGIPEPSPPPALHDGAEGGLLLILQRDAFHEQDYGNMVQPDIDSAVSL